MADEVTVPLLPCSSIDVIADFYRVLGFRVTYRQTRPNPYLTLRREDLHLHFFGIADFDSENSYGSCLVLVPDVEGLYQAFAVGMRAAYGKVLVSGIPRMTRPRAKKNMDGVTGFSVVDPGGNWIRITAKSPPGATPEPTGRLAVTLQNAVVQGDSRGDHRQAARILDGGLTRPDAGDDPAVLVQALAYRAETAMTLADPDTARESLTRIERVELTADVRQQIAAVLDTVAELADSLP
ncbi:VOC family protein [Pilimelia columellifera]|uniref:VOC family protein n=1 Tax=Pilimelia columellifera subsp. columellifera TaxID=706583 RepID=A0ABN3NQI7_9ACTN